MKKYLISIVLLAAMLALCIVPACAQEKEVFFYDPDGVLDDDLYDTLNPRLKKVSDEYDCGVYILIAEDMYEYGYDDIEEFAQDVYEELELGYGKKATGVALVMSMEDRDYDIVAYGDDAHYAFTDYGKKQLAEVFKDDFRNDDWEEGFLDFIDQCDTMLEMAEDGNPLDVPPPRKLSLAEKIGSSLPIGVIVGLISGLINGGVQKKKMRTAVPAYSAGVYITEDGTAMTSEQDHFINTTVVRQRIEHSSSSGGGGGTTVNSSGYSHSSGKF